MEAKTVLESGALWVDGEGLAVIRAVGNDRLTWLNALVTADVKDLTQGAARYALLLEKKGKITSDIIVLSTAAGLDLVVPGAVADAVGDVLEHHLIMEDVELSRPDVAIALLHGGASARVAEASGAPWGALDRTGLGGAIVVGESLADAKARAVAAGALVAPADVWARLRVERAVPLFGVDFDATHYPQEASLAEAAVSFSKGCYLGQEVAYMLQNRGQAKRHVVRLRLERPATPGDVVTAEGGAEVGVVTSAAEGLVDPAPFALAMVKRAHAERGARLAVAGAPAIVDPPA
ncbi:MAG: folate-binding protein YgfZ [Myxococcales bacterium]|nr:folate-binding protein YgfZ [Myxococcales bacterium]